MASLIFSGNEATILALFHNNLVLSLHDHYSHVPSEIFRHFGISELNISNQMLELAYLNISSKRSLILEKYIMRYCLHATSFAPSDLGCRRENLHSSTPYCMLKCSRWNFLGSRFSRILSSSSASRYLHAFTHALQHFTYGCVLCVCLCAAACLLRLVVSFSHVYLSLLAHMQVLTYGVAVPSGLFVPCILVGRYFYNIKTVSKQWNIGTSLIISNKRLFTFTNADRANTTVHSVGLWRWYFSFLRFLSRTVVPTPLLELRPW